jgi:hypothetical protein
VNLTIVWNAQDFQLLGRKNGDRWMGCGVALLLNAF